MGDLRHDIKVIEDEHRQIRAMAVDLKTFLEAPRPEVGSDTGHDWANTLAEKLTHLHDKLFRHFREEERSGCMEELAKNFPRVTHQVQALTREHDRILADLRTILGAAMTYSAGQEPENPRLRRWILALLEQLRQHEGEETELFQKLHYQDIGAAD